MCSAFDRMDIVDIGLHVFSEFSAVLQRNIVLSAIFFTRNLNHVTVQGIACPIEMFNKFDQTTLILEVTPFTVPFIMELDVDTAVEESQFLQTLVQGVKVVLGNAENLVVSLERRLGTRFLGRPSLEDRTCRHASLIFLRPSEPIATDLGLSPLTEKVDDRHTHPM